MLTPGLDGDVDRARADLRTAEQLLALAEAATRFGSQAMELTSRGNVQVRGVTDSTATGTAAFTSSLNTILSCSKTGAFHATSGTVTFTKVDTLTSAAAQLFGE